MLRKLCPVFQVCDSQPELQCIEQKRFYLNHVFDQIQLVIVPFIETLVLQGSVHELSALFRAPGSCEASTILLLSYTLC